MFSHGYLVSTAFLLGKQGTTRILSLNTTAPKKIGFLFLIASFFLSFIVSWFKKKINKPIVMLLIRLPQR